MPGFGSNAILGITKQNSFDGTSAPNSFFNVPFAKHDFNYNFSELIDDSITGRYDAPDPTIGLQLVNGNIEHPFHPLVGGHFLRGAMGVYSVAAVGSGFTHQFKPQTTTFDTLASLPPFSFYLDQGETGVNTVYKLTDCFINGLEFSAAAGGWLRANYIIVGKGTDVTTKLVPAGYGTGVVRPFPWSSISLSLFGAADQKWSDITFRFDNRIGQQTRLAASKQYQYFFRDGFRDFGRISGTVDIAIDTWTRVKSETEGRLFMFAAGVTSISSGVNEYLLIDIPRFKFTAHPLGVSGPGIVQVAVTGDAMYSSTRGLIVAITLQNTLSTY